MDRTSNEGAAGASRGAEQDEERSFGTEVNSTTADSGRYRRQTCELPEQPDPDTLVTELPPAMQTARRWLLWRAEPAERGGKPRKVPYYSDGARRSGTLDGPEDVSRLVDLPTAIAAMASGAWAGLGFALGPDGAGNHWQGIDLDGTDKRPDLLPLVDLLPGYVERSPSGNGYHAIGIGSDFPALGPNHSGIEAYSHGRFFTVTGDALRGDLEDLAQAVATTLAPLHTRAEAPKSRAVSTPDSPIIEGTRNYTLFRLGASMRANGFGEPAIRDALVTENVERCRPPLENAEVKAIAASACRYKRGESPQREAYTQAPESTLAMRVVEDWPDPDDPFAQVVAPQFPLDVLPTVMGDYVADQSERMGVDPGMLALFGLAIAASALTDQIQIYPKRNDPTWRESARIWTAAVGNPTIMKTPAFKAMSGPLYAQEDEWRKSGAKLTAAYESALKAHQKDTESDPPEPPVIHRAFVENTSVEKLSDILSRTPRGTLLHHDELSGFFGGMDAYRERGVSVDRAEYLSLFNGGPHLIDRIRRGSIWVGNWGASIVGGIQPEPMRRVARNLADDGLLQRFNVFLARDAVEGHDRQRDCRLHDKYADLVRGLYAIQGGSNIIGYSDDAIEFQRDIVRIGLSVAGLNLLPTGLRTHLGKLGGMFARYALLFHAIEQRQDRKHPEASSVSVATAKRVNTLFRNFLVPHAYAFYDQVVHQGHSLKRAQWLAGFILARRLESIDRRTIRSSYRELRDGSDAEIHNAMQGLDAFGWVAPVSGERFPVKRWIVNPKLHSVYAERAEQEREHRERVRSLLAGIRGTPRTSTTPATPENVVNVACACGVEGGGIQNPLSLSPARKQQSQQNMSGNPEPFENPLRAADNHPGDPPVWHGEIPLPGDADDAQWEASEERAAIIEHDGGASRQFADKVAGVQPTDNTSEDVMRDWLWRRIDVEYGGWSVISLPTSDPNRAAVLAAERVGQPVTVCVRHARTDASDRATPGSHHAG